MLFFFFAFFFLAKKIAESVENHSFYFICLIFVFSFVSVVVFATNFRVKAAMKNSVLLSWEVRDKNPAQLFTVSRFLLQVVSRSRKITTPHV